MKILLGLSGGLDSTYCAVLLKEKGYDVVGADVVMSDYTDVKSAKKSADEVGIPFVTVDGKDAFEKYVVSDFVNEYCRGRTPNPCIKCNPHVKIGALCDYAEKNGFDKVATGHYASVGFADGRYYIIPDTQSGKDQSYVLWGLTQKQLSYLYFPLFSHDKGEIRKKADTLSLSAAKSGESQDICFIPDGDYASFIKARTRKTFPEGNYIDGDGRVLGRHKGIINYTVGQRRGLNIALGERMYVSDINPEKNEITLLPYENREIKGIKITNINRQKLGKDEKTARGCVRVRYSAKPVKCECALDGNDGTLTLCEPLKAASPGQSAVIYDGDGILFGGIIDKIIYQEKK